MWNYDPNRYKELNGYIVDGYIKNTENETNMNIPSVINGVVADFYTTNAPIRHKRREIYRSD